MANPWFRSLRRIPLSFLRNLSSSDPLTSRLIPIKPNPIPTHTTPSLLSQKWVLTRNFSHGSVHLVISKGKPKFETRKTEPLTKEKWKTKKRFKQQRKRDKDKRKSVNKRDPRFIGVKGKKKKQKFATTSWPITLIIPSTRRRRSTTSAASSRDVLRHSLAKFPIHVYGSVWHRFPF